MVSRSKLSIFVTLLPHKAQGTSWKGRQKDWDSPTLGKTLINNVFWNVPGLWANELSAAVVYKRLTHYQVN